MFLTELMKKKQMTRADLSEISSVPESALRDILNGTSQIEHCEALTLSLIADALDTTVEDILVEAFNERLAQHTNPMKREIVPTEPLHLLYCFMGQVMTELNRRDEKAFANYQHKGDWVRQFGEFGFYGAALLLLGIMDYLCRKNNWPLFPGYDSYRNMCLDHPVYPLRLMDPCLTYDKFTSEKDRIMKNAIPELARFNIFITEEDIRLQA